MGRNSICQHDKPNISTILSVLRNQISTFSAVFFFHVPHVGVCRCGISSDGSKEAEQYGKQDYECSLRAFTGNKADESSVMSAFLPVLCCLLHILCSRMQLLHCIVDRPTSHPSTYVYVLKSSKTTFLFETGQYRSYSFYNIFGRVIANRYWDLQKHLFVVFILLLLRPRPNCQSNNLNANNSQLKSVMARTATQWQ